MIVKPEDSVYVVCHKQTQHFIPKNNKFVFDKKRNTNGEWIVDCNVKELTPSLKKAKYWTYKPHARSVSNIIYKRIFDSIISDSKQPGYKPYCYVDYYLYRGDALYNNSNLPFITNYIYDQIDIIWRKLFEIKEVKSTEIHLLPQHDINKGGHVLKFKNVTPNNKFVLNNHKGLYKHCDNCGMTLGDMPSLGIRGVGICVFCMEKYSKILQEAFNTIEPSFKERIIQDRFLQKL